MRVLVTGGAGFIGSHVVDELVAAAHEVVVLDLLHPAAHDGVPGYCHAGTEYRWGDIADPATAAEAVRGCDAVAHQAAMVGLGVDFNDVAEYCRHNDLGTATLLAALHRSGFAGRLVLASSMVVYGEGRYRCAVHGLVRPTPRSTERLDRGLWEPLCSCGAVLVPEPIVEDAPTDPRNVYAATKLHQEHLCAAFAREHPSVGVTALRYHNVYGPRMPHDTPYAGVASIFRSALAHGRATAVYEDGGQLRDFVHVRDVAHANVLALTAATPVSGPLNVASGSPRTVLEMARALTAAFGAGAPAPEVVGGYRLGDVRHVFASPARAADELGFTSTIEFNMGMAEFATAGSRNVVGAAAR
jgi:dTDP-L-rhamnose 4-epimerase